MRFGRAKIFRRLYPPIEDAVFALSDSIIVHSESQRQALPWRIRRKAQVVEFGVSKCPSSSTAEPAAPVVGCFGMVSPHKGIETVIEACRLASVALPNLRLLIAGSLPSEHAGFGEALRTQLAQALGERGELRLDLPQEGFDSLFHRAGIVCFGLRHVNQSTSLYRALAHGKPVVVTDVGGVAEVVKREGAGAVVPVDDPQAMAAAMTRLLQNRRAYRAAQKAVERYARERTWAANAADHAELYEKLAS